MNRLTPQHNLQGVSLSLHRLTISNSKKRANPMEIWGLGVAWALLGIFIVTVATTATERLWWKPRRLERALRAQGLKGPSYRLFSSDPKEDARIKQEAKSKPMAPHSHNVIPRLAPLFDRSFKQYGKISFTWTGRTPAMNIADPELIREVMNNKIGHIANPEAGPIGRLLVTGLARYEGEKWAKHRKIINPAFHMEKLKQMLPAFSTCCTDLISRWQNVVGSKGPCELDVWPELQQFTGDVISRAAFGSSYEEGRRIFQLQTEQIMLIFMSIQTAHIPGYRLLPTRNNLRLKAIDREVRELLGGIIEKRKRAIKQGSANSDDLLGLLLESNLNEEHGKYSKHGMTTQEVVDECKLFYFAGQESTSVLLTWTLVLLSMHPSWQSRAREEVLGFYGKKKPDVDSLNRLKIVPMILNEVLRLYPPLISLTRRTCKKVELGGIIFPEGLRLNLPIIFPHLEQEYWGKDAHEFNPERFAGGVAKASNDQGAFFPFGWGPRICIGQNFAMLEAKLGLSMLLQHFEFELSPSYVHAPLPATILQPQQGAPLMLRKL